MDRENPKYVWKDGTLWARGYYIASIVDNVTAEVVQEYINNQKAGKENSDKNSDSSYRQSSLF